MPTKNEPIRTKIDDLVTKKSSVIEKVKPHRARILFWKSVKTCPKWFAAPDFFVLYQTVAQVEHGACPQKMSQFGLKLTIW